MKIGLLLIATGKYDIFIEPLIESIEKHFFKNHNVYIFLFTDSDKEYDYTNTKIIYKEHKPFPYPTLERYKTFSKNSELFDDCDYLFYCDIDMLFVDDVDTEILSERVATIHPGFLGKRGTPETRKESLAYVSPKEKLVYYAGGFNGGTKNEFLKMSKHLSENIQKDLDRNIIAIWHDESHMNRYFLDNPPTKVLTPSYCYPESWQLPFKKKLLALDKNHSEIRN